MSALYGVVNEVGHPPAMGGLVGGSPAPADREPFMVRFDRAMCENWKKRKPLSKQIFKVYDESDS